MTLIVLTGSFKLQPSKPTEYSLHLDLGGTSCLHWLSPRFLEKASGILFSPPSVRPFVRYVISSQIAGQNPTKFGEWLAYTSGACKSTFIFGPAPRGPGEGSKGQILTISNFKVNFKDFYAKMCTYTQ